MNKNKYSLKLVLFLVIVLFKYNSNATKLISVQSIDNKCLVLHFQDGFVEYNHDDTISGSCNGWDYLHTEKWSLCPDKDQYVAFGEPINTEINALNFGFILVSVNDKNFGLLGKTPIKISRKSKVWEASHDERTPAMHHRIYLDFSDEFQQGVNYTLKINDVIQSDKNEVEFVFNELEMESPAIKISNVGYQTNACLKTADVYLWKGDGGEHDFSRLTNTPFYIFDLSTNSKVFSGNLNFRMANKIESGYNHDFTGSDVWECDFSAFNKPGKYKLVIKGIGSSAQFEISENNFEEPLKVAMQGMFYQRMGCNKKPAGDFPKARQPLFIPGVDPEGFEVFISEKDMVTGTNPDNRNYYSEQLTGEKVLESWGGWSDAYDNDQRPVNFICVFDILLAYYLNPEVFTDNQLYIPEQNNGVPDIIDEALWEIDWWLRMRDSQGGYLTGLTNITNQKINYAGAPCAWQGWCVAAGCAMAADCFRLAGNMSLQNKYTNEAKIAWEWAKNQNNKMLDVDVSGLRGKDLKITAAAFLFNLTGDKNFETEFKSEMEVSSPFSKIRNMGNWEQQFAALAYLETPQKISYPQLQKNINEAFINQAKTDYMAQLEESPTKAIRWTSSWDGMAQTSNEISLVAIAHKISNNEDEKKYFEKGLYAEAEWTLGRNPLGLVQMTGLGDRCITQTFAPGRRDGYPGVTPGWTPYMCRDGWMKGEDNIHGCDWYTSRNFPSDKTIWPQGEHFWNSRYCVPNSESTPQQNFRQKIVLYGYLFGINK